MMMGLSRTIPLPNGEPSWDAVVQGLLSLGETPQLRMIDGLPAFPDETPPDDWRELRVTLSGGMVTIKRDVQAWTLVTWGTADAVLEEAQERLAQSIRSVPGN
jgi:hypothetical protein